MNPFVLAKVFDCLDTFPLELPCQLLPLVDLLGIIFAPSSFLIEPDSS